MLARWSISDPAPDGVLSTGCVLNKPTLVCVRLRHCAASLTALGSMAARMSRMPTTMAATCPAPIIAGGAAGGVGGGAAGGVGGEEMGGGAAGGVGGDGSPPHKHQKFCEQAAVLVVSALKYRGLRFAL